MISNARGPSLLLDEELDLETTTMIITLHTDGTGINIHVDGGVLNGLV